MEKRKDAEQNAVLWDMDGVLVDTGEFHYLTWKETLELNGIPFSRRDFQHTFGMNNEQVLTLVLGHKPDPGRLKEMSDLKEENFRKMVRDQSELNPAVLELLDQVQEAGIKQAIASSAPAENIEAVIDKLHIRDFFRAIVSGDSLPSKPDPTVFRHAARALGVLPENCIVVEDAIAGIGAAKRANMKCIAVAATHPIADLEDADLAVPSLDELTMADLIQMFDNN